LRTFCDYFSQAGQPTQFLLLQQSPFQNEFDAVSCTDFKMSKKRTLMLGIGRYSEETIGNGIGRGKSSIDAS